MLHLHNLLQSPQRQLRKLKSVVKSVNTCGGSKVPTSESATRPTAATSTAKETGPAISKGYKSITIPVVCWSSVDVTDHVDWTPVTSAAHSPSPSSSLEDKNHKYPNPFVWSLLENMITGADTSDKYSKMKGKLQ